MVGKVLPLDNSTFESLPIRGFTKSTGSLTQLVFWPIEKTGANSSNNNTYFRIINSLLKYKQGYNSLGSWVATKGLPG
jgi:hypothetical protein